MLFMNHDIYTYTLHFYVFRGKMASLRRVKNSSALPNSDQTPEISLSKELPSSADLKFVSHPLLPSPPAFLPICFSLIFFSDFRSKTDPRLLTLLLLGWRSNTESHLWFSLPRPDSMNISFIINALLLFIITFIICTCTRHHNYNVACLF